MNEHIDVLIIGAGISGIGAAYHVQTRCPDRSYAVLEARERLGGTWDLFRYPGIRSDSDMHTMGFRFKPWTGDKALADGASILAYLEETAREHGIDQHIRYGHRLVCASWSSDTNLWTVRVERIDGDTKTPLTLSCRFLFSCTGYYDYDEGYTPTFAGVERFKGRIVHPQKWSDDIDYADKRVVVIGSGATAVTLVPTLAQSAAHVTMLQRTPSYIASVPAEDRVAKALRGRLSPTMAYALTRWKNIFFGLGLFAASRRAPRRVRRFLKDAVRRELGPDYDVDTHFEPPYDPWDQRMCLVPDADLFAALREGTASIVTEHIDTFTEKGLRLESGRELEADLVVTATGLKLSLMAGVTLTVDGKPVDASEHWTYKAMMFDEVPNFALWFGYTNASWTLKADLTSEYVCRVLNHMKRHGYQRFVARQRGAALADEPFIDFSSGYIQRAQHLLPKQGTKMPWRLHQNYLLDVLNIRFSRVDDGVMEFH